jgi:hypothetical protein
MAGLPSCALRLLPVLLLLLGLLALGGRLRRLVWPQRSVAMLTILLLPVALNGASIINTSSPGDRGRFVAAYAYGLVFFLAQAMRVRWLRYPALALAALVLWFFLALAMQQTNAAQFKNIGATIEFRDEAGHLITGEKVLANLWSKVLSTAILTSIAAAVNA